MVQSSVQIGNDLAVRSLDREGAIPLYYQLMQLFKDSPRMSEPGAQFFTEREISDAYGVSRHTARQAIKGLVEDGYLYTKQGKGTFVKARKEKENLPNFLLFLPHQVDYYMQYGDYVMGDLIRGINSEIQRTGNLIITDIPESEDETEFCIHKIEKTDCDGIILLDLKNINLIVSTAKKNHIPYVLLNVKQRGWEENNNVIADEVGGVKAAVSYLFELGHKKIGYIKEREPRPLAHFATRVLGYKDALQERNIPLDNDLIREWTGYDSLPGIKDLLTGENVPTAIFVESDRIALELVEYLGSWGMKIPEDVSVVGFDNSPGSKNSKPPLTTVNKPRIGMGREAVRFLKDLKAESFMTKKSRTLKTRVVKRESCRKI